MRVETLRHPSGQQIPILLDAAGLPLVAPNEWVLKRYDLSENTLSRNLRELTVLYLWASRRDIDIEERVRSGRGFTEAEITGSLIADLKKDRSKRIVVKVAVSPAVLTQRITTCADYLSWLFDACMALTLDAKLRNSIGESKKRVIGWLADGLPSSSVSTGIPANRLLSRTQREFLLSELLLPVNALNLSSQRRARDERNRVAILLMLMCGLRIGELLSLKVEDIQYGAITSLFVKRRPSDPVDARQPRPLVKRNSRTLWLDPELAHLVNDYTLRAREQLLCRSPHDTEYLIVSDEGDPISINRMYRICKELSKKFPGQLPDGLSPHSFRHSFSEDLERVLREAGVEESRRRQHLALLRGDSSLDSQNVYIAAEINEEANKALLMNQRRAMDRAKDATEKVPH